jgi:hypothetical protein
MKMYKLLNGRVDPFMLPILSFLMCPPKVPINLDEISKQLGIEKSI